MLPFLLPIITTLDLILRLRAPESNAISVKGQKTAEIRWVMNLFHNDNDTGNEEDEKNSLRY